MLTDADARAKLRADMRAMRDALDAGERERASKDICRALLASDMWKRAGSVFVYFAVGSEVDTLPLIKAALSDGKALYLPRCVKRGDMRAIRTLSLDELRPGRYGIPEPAGEHELDASPDLCIAPGLAFDIAGGRLGYGGGYYDRYLAKYRPHTAALAYQCQMIASVPVQAHDMRMDNIITPAGIAACDERA